MGRSSEKSGIMNYNNENTSSTMAEAGLNLSSRAFPLTKFTIFRPCFCWMIMNGYTGMEVAIPLNHRSLARISSGTDHALPIGCVRPFGSHVVAVTQAVH